MDSYQSIDIDRSSVSGVKNMDMFTDMFTKFTKSESGVTAIEYGLIASLIAVVIITAVTLVGTNLTAVFTSVAGKL